MPNIHLATKAAEKDDVANQELEALDVETNFLDETDNMDDQAEDRRHHPEESLGLVTPPSATSSHTGNDSPIAMTDASPLVGTSIVALMILILLSIALSSVMGYFLWVFFWIVFLVFLVTARATMPPPDTFHAKEQIRRSKKQQAKAADKNKKQKHWLRRTAQKATSAVTTEVKNAVGGFDDTQFADVGVGLLVITRDLTNGHYHAWLGLFGEWRSLEVLNDDTKAALHEWMWRRSRVSNQSYSVVTQQNIV